MAYTFVNPYTFVPFPENGAVRYDLTDLTNNGEPVFSGEIRCTLIAKTQIAVPDILKNPNASDNEVKEYDFFSIDVDSKRTAAIPGSGIRGVIRNVYETLTDSCVHLNDKDDDYFHTRVNKTTPGIIEFDGKSYVLYEAERIRDKTGSSYSTGDEVKFTAKNGDRNASRLVDFFSDTGDEKGVYLRVNTFRTSKGVSHPSVFIKGEAVERNFDKRYIDRLKVNVEMYEGKYKNEYQKAISNMEKQGKKLPVWYWKDTNTGHYYLAPSQYSRAVFVNQPKDLVELANIKSCTSKKNACAACALFGFIGDEDSKASHVRFTDAVCKTDNCFDGSYIMPVLSGPRLSSFEFYLNGGNSRKYGPDSAGVTLAGRKFYWHDPNPGAKIMKDDPFAMEHPKMASKMELVRAGSKFEFSVFFDRITDDQLKKLVFALNLGDNKSFLCHKIGHGKPIGLGSVKIKVDSITKRSYNGGIYSFNNVTEDILSQSTIDLFPSFTGSENFLQKVMNFNYLKDKTIDYPRQQPGGDIFKWFAGNRGALRSQGYIEVKQLLPKITDNTQTLLGQLPDNRDPQGGNNRNYSNGRYNQGRRN